MYKKFTRPTIKDIDDAIGNVNSPFFTYKNSTCFKLIPEPGSSDWLYSHPEEKQTCEGYKEMMKSGFFRAPTEKKNTIYIQPMGNFESRRIVKHELIKEYVEIFFSQKCAVLPTFTYEEAVKLHQIKTRKIYNNKITQLYTVHVSEFLKKSREAVGGETRAENDLLTLGLTSFDLWPGTGWNFCYGEAMTEMGLGMYSFIRYDPKFPYTEGTDEALTHDEYVLVTRRALSTVSHEIGHLFGLPHCVYFSCVMNGSNHLEECDKSPMFLCPVCLKKLHIMMGFDISKRYEKMNEFFKKYKLTEYSQWVEKRMKEVGDEESGKGDDDMEDEGEIEN